MEDNIGSAEPKNNRALYWLLAALAIVIILGGAVYAWQNNRSTVADNNLDTQSSPANELSTATPGLTSPTPASSPTVAASDSASFLVIKELGIKIPLSTTIKDLNYVYKCTNGGGSDTTNCLHFSTDSIASIPSSAGTSASHTCEAIKDPLGTYNVYQTQQSPRLNPEDGYLGQLVASVNGHYVYYNGPQYACGDNKQDQAKVAALREPVLAAVKQAQSN